MKDTPAMFPVAASPVAEGGMWLIGGVHRLLCADSTLAATYATLLGGGRVQAIIADPPYGITHDRWDAAVAPDAFLDVALPHLLPDAWLAFFGQMPTLLDWCNAAAARLKWKDHIAWIKRVPTAIALPITRAHESIMVYKQGKPKYITTKGKYEDVKVPGVLVDMATLETIQRYIGDLHTWIKRGAPRVVKPSSSRADVYAYFNSNHKQAPEHVNFTNVWSFLPENQRTFKTTNDTRHATKKPVLVYQRLCELLCTDDGAFLDPFVGSGTAIIAAHRSGRVCYGVERNPDFCQMVLERCIAEGLTVETLQ